MQMKVTMLFLWIAVFSLLDLSKGTMLCHALLCDSREWAFPLRGVFPTKHRAQVSCTAGRFFAIWATRPPCVIHIAVVQLPSRVHLFVPMGSLWLVEGKYKVGVGKQMGLIYSEKKNIKIILAFSKDVSPVTLNTVFNINCRWSLGSLWLLLAVCGYSCFRIRWVVVVVKRLLGKERLATIVFGVFLK